jgi:hypothetical protein
MFLDPDAQVQAYRMILHCENRCQQIESSIARLKHVLLTDAAQLSLPDAVAALQDVRQQVKGVLEQAAQLERAVGIQRVSLSSASEPSSLDSPSHSIRGSTHTIPIPDLLSLLSSQRKTGTLRIQTRHERFVLEFLEGAVVHAASDSPRPDQLLGEILVARDKLRADKLDEFLDRYKSTDGRIGEVMARASLVSEQDLRDALEFQVRKLFERLFVLEDATFCFNDGPVSDVELRVSLNTTQLLLEAARCEDEQMRRLQSGGATPDDEAVGLASGVQSWLLGEEAEEEEEAEKEAVDEAEPREAEGEQLAAAAVADQAARSDTEPLPAAATEAPASEASAETPAASSADEGDDEAAERELLEALAKASPRDPAALLDLGALPRLGNKLAAELAEHGIKTLGDLIAASDEMLLAIPGIGDKKLAALRAFAKS